MCILSITGYDHGANLLWLAVDDAVTAYTRRINRGFAVDADVVHAVGPGGNYPTQVHTIRHFGREPWWAH